MTKDEKLRMSDMAWESPHAGKKRDVIRFAIFEVESVPGPFLTVAACAK